MTIPANISKVIRICLIAMPTALAAFSAQTGWVSALPSAQPVPGDASWHAGVSLNGVDSFDVEAVVIDGNRIYVGGSFGLAGGSVRASSVAMWDGTAWQALGSGVDGEVKTLAVDSRGRLYAGGQFTQAGGNPVNAIARWDGQAWKALGEGVAGGNQGITSVDTIAIDANDQVYVGGSFTSAGGETANSIARWDGSKWHALGKGLQGFYAAGTVNAIAIDPAGAVFAGGNFLLAGYVPANNVARWDGAAWSGLVLGIATASNTGETVRALAVDRQGNLYAGGEFKKGGEVKANNIAKWDGKQWTALDKSITTASFDGLSVRCLAVDGDNLLAGGWFTQAGRQPVDGLARWDGKTWQNINAGDWTGINVPNGNNFTAILGLAVGSAGEWAAVGNFVIAGGQSARNVAVWDGQSWQGLGVDNTVDRPIFDMIPDGKGGVYVGGGFFSIYGKFVNRLAHWDGESWSPVGGSMPGSSDYSRVLALALDKKGDLVAGGGFYQAGSAYAGNIAEWDGKTWRSLGSGTPEAEEITSVAADSQANVYAGGRFAEIGGVEAQFLAKWNGSQWEALGAGLDGPPAAMVVDDQDRLVVCGKFSLAGDLGVDGLARWNGKAWEWLNDDKIQRWPTSLLMDRGTLYLGGKAVWAYREGVFTVVGGETANFGGGTVNAMAVDSRGRLIVGGDFARVGDVAANYIARWNGAVWETLGRGTDQAVTALAADGYGTIWVAGNFTQAGGQPANGFAHWTDPVYIRNWQPSKAQ